MTLRKALCQGYVTEKMLECWATKHDTTPHIIKRELLVLWMLQVVAFFFIFLSIPLFILECSLLPVSMALCFPLACLAVSFVPIFMYIRNYWRSKGVTLMEDVYKMYKKLTGGEPGGDFYASSLSFRVEHFLLNQARLISVHEGTMNDTTCSFDERGWAGELRKEAKNESSKGYKLFANFGLISEPMDHYFSSK